MSAGPRSSSTGRTMLGCAAAIIVGVAAMVGALAIAVWSIDIDIDFAGVDADPGQGTESARIPVEVTPRTGLTDGTVVTVNSEAFRRSTVVGVAVCLAEADTEARGVDACDEVKGARYAVSSDGKLSATYPVPRVVTIGGVAHDCAASGTSCLVVAADASDYDHSGGQTISFRTDLGPTDLAISTSRPGSDQLAVIPPDAGAVAARSSVVVAASGFQPGEPVLMAHCAGFPQASIQACDPIDDSTAMAAIMFRTVDGATDLADDTGTVTYTFEALVSFDPPFDANADPDCTDPAARCSFVIAAAADTKRSAVVPYAIAP